MKDANEQAFKYRNLEQNQGPEPDEIDNVIKEVVDLAGQINLEGDSDAIQELLDFHNQELIIDNLINMHEQEHKQGRSYYRISCINNTSAQV
ncbi:hypothetical protein TNCV_375101 [Trichonephila clavipes]|nr:hypothetical protein TNCV_375101 [Trichonephila clavipes]